MRHVPPAAAIVAFLLLAELLLPPGHLVVAQTAPGDVTLKRTGPETPREMPIAVFPHWRHRLHFTCNVCHPATFPMKVGETGISMDDIFSGKFCGACHNGSVAWGVSLVTCARCHAGL